MTSITVTVPCDPPSVLLPNRKRNLHWSTVAKATKELREIARYAAQDQMPNDWTPMTGPVVLSLTVGYGRRRRLPDLDGSASACKAALDGMTDAGIITDDRIIKRLEVEHEKDSTGEGYITLTFSSAPDAP